MAPIVSRIGFSRGFGGRRGFLAQSYSVSPSTSSLNEGSSVTFTVTTTNVSSGTTLYWTLNAVSGTINASDFSGGATSGSFTITSNSGSVALTLANDVTTEGTESFQLQVRTDSTSGTIVATSSTVTINDTSVAISASGGTVTAEGISPGNGYRYHVFTSPGTFTVNSGTGNVEYLVVAGGGGSGDYYGGGGGAGGFRTNVSGHPLAGSAFPVSPGPYSVTVGSGGPGPAQPGSPSSFATITSTGGGNGKTGGGAGGSVGPGGSGGGGGAQNGVPVVPGGTGNTPPTSPPQGNPGGGGYYAGTYPAGGGGGAGAAGGSAGNASGTGQPGGAGSPVAAFAAPLLSPQIPAPAQPTWIPAVGPTGLYAGGGAGGSPNAGQTGGAGGGGGPGSPGVNFTGGGAGGDNNGGAGKVGGTGIVIIRYSLGGASYTYTGYALNNANGTQGAANGTPISASNAGAQPNVGGTATFNSGIVFSTLRVIYGNMSNSSLGNKDSGAVLSINGSNVTATGVYGTDGYNSSYHKYYDATNGTLNSIGISAGVGGSHESAIFAIIIDGNKLTASGPTWS